MSDLLDNTGFLELAVDIQCLFGFEEARQKAVDKIQNLFVIIQIAEATDGYIHIPVFIFVRIRIFRHEEPILVFIRANAGVEATARLIVARPVVFDRNNVLFAISFDFDWNAIEISVDAADVFNFVNLHIWTS